MVPLKCLDHGDGQRGVELVMMSQSAEDLPMRISLGSFGKSLKNDGLVKGSEHVSDPFRLFDRPLI